MHVRMTINGKHYEADVEPRMLLADLIREEFGLTGTKVGCDTGQCGSCAIIMNGVSVKSCMILAVQADGADIHTIEGVAHNGVLGALQEGLHIHSSVQCGFCTPGIVMSMTDMLQRNPAPDEPEIRRWMHGNLCRCTGYQNVVSAVQHAIAKNTSKVKMIIDTPRKQMYENRVELLMAGEVDRLVEEHYNEDAVLISFDFTVRGHAALKEHFRKFVKWVALKEVVSTDRFVETEDSFFYEATAITNYGKGRVYDAYHLRNGKIDRHFTGIIN